MIEEQIKLVEKLILRLRVSKAQAKCDKYDNPYSWGLYDGLQIAQDRTMEMLESLKRMETAEGR
jgi:hypothetical protein